MTTNWDRYGNERCVMHCALGICKTKNVCLEQHAIKRQDNMKNDFEQYQYIIKNGSTKSKYI